MRQARRLRIRRRPTLAIPAVLTGVVVMLAASGIARGDARLDDPEISGEPPAFVSPPAGAVPTGVRYKVIEIPLRYSLSTDRLSINESGDVTGTYENHENNRRGDCAFFYHNGEITDIKSASDDRTVAVGLNNRGQVLVYRRSLQGSNDPFIWDSGRFKSVGPMPKDFLTWNRGIESRVWVGECRVCSINKSGDVAGFLVQGHLPSDGIPDTRPFCWHDGVMTLLTESGRTGPNQDFAGLPSYLKIIQNGVYNFQSEAMNDSGDIVGDTPGGGFAASSQAVVVWKAGHGRGIQFTGARSTVGAESQSLAEGNSLPEMLHPCALNNRGDWVGTHSGMFGEQACLWAAEENAVHDLDERLLNLPADAALQRMPISSAAYGVNDNGQIVGDIVSIVGNTRTGKQPGERACVWVNRKAFDLNTMIDNQTKCFLSRAYSTNNSGQIVAVGPRTDFRDPIYLHAYILTPITHGP